MRLEVRVNSVRGSQMAAKLAGRFSLGGAEYRFTAIAFGRIGGQNVGARVSGESRRRLASAGHDPDEVVMELQRCLLQGDLTIPEGVRRDSFADG